MKRIKLKSVQAKFLALLIPTISIILILLAILIYTNERNSQMKIIDNMSTQVVDARADEIAEWLTSIIIEMDQIAEKDMVQTMQWENMEGDMKKVAEKQSERYGFLGVVYPDGYYYSTASGKSDVSISNKGYFKDIFERGKDFSISDPMKSLTTGVQSIFVVVPIKNDSAQLVGMMVASVYINTLSDIASKIKMGDDGYGFIIDSEGKVVAHPKEEFHGMNLLNSDSLGFENLDAVGSEMLNQKSGSGTITTPQGLEEYIVYAKIPTSPGWILGIAIPYEQILASINQLLIYIAAMFLATLIILYLVIFFMTRNIITSPLKGLIVFTKGISSGKLYQKMEIKTNDEVGQMAGSLMQMSEKLRNIVESIRSGADSIALGSNEMNASAEQIAQGVSEQASSAEEVSSSMEEMSSMINQNANNAQQTEKTALKAAKDIEEVKRSMDITVNAMRNIAEKITIIGEIAGKTDLLAINAAIEAARAGEHGKGFAVVASEVRKLAERSQEAAKEIDEVSHSSVEIAEKSGKLLEEVVPVIQNNANLVREISASSAEQNSGADQVNNAITQLAQVTQQNSASSEELATGSEELASQAQQLKDAIAYFKINEADISNTIDDLTSKTKTLLETIAQMKSDKDQVTDTKTEDQNKETNQEKNQKKEKKDNGNNGINLKLDNDKNDDADKDFEKF